MLKLHLIFIFFLFVQLVSVAQCPTCGNGAIDAGETNLNCPQDISHSASCANPCGQPNSFESAAGARISLDFVGTTTYAAASLPVGWTFAGAPTTTTSGTLPVADTYGAKGGLVQPNCSGGCAATNGFCIGNLASNVAVGGGGANGKLGANFDGRANINQNLSYAVLRGQGNPTLVSESYNTSGVEGFKIQFWLFPSETSCGQSNSWGSCAGNTAFLDFSVNGGTTWSQVMEMNLSSTNTDMCLNNTSNTKWLNESSWSRVCLTVFKTTTSPGNFYPAATSATAASGIMVNSAYFAANFKYRIRYAQSASCTSGISTTNPGRYLAIDYPVFTSGNEMIPCGISFSKMCGYGEDNNDDGVGGSGTSTTNVFTTVRRGVNNAERGVEILTSQNASFASQNLTGSTFATNFDLCNAEGGDKQCIDWQSNNNFYTVVYECVTDWEAPSGNGINVQYYKGTTPQSIGMSKVTAAGKTALKGWRYSANRFVSCGSSSDLNPGCNGYSFLSGGLPTQFSRGFYGLAINSTGNSWSYYGASSCSNYFNGPFFAPVAIPDTVGTNMVVCSSGDPVFSGNVDYCFEGAGMSGTATLSITGPNGFTETIASGDTGVVPIVDAGEYIVTASPPASPAQCLNCSKTVCITLSATDLDICNVALPVEMIDLNLSLVERKVLLTWKTESESNNDYFEIQRSTSMKNFVTIGSIDGAGDNTTLLNYSFLDENPLESISYYRIKQVDIDGKSIYSPILSAQIQGLLNVYPNPSTGVFILNLDSDNTAVEIVNSIGKRIYSTNNLSKGQLVISIENEADGIYTLKTTSIEGVKFQRLIKTTKEK
jgi:hypothetical protein